MNGLSVFIEIVSRRWAGAKSMTQIAEEAVSLEEKKAGRPIFRLRSLLKGARRVEDRWANLLDVAEDYKAAGMTNFPWAEVRAYGVEEEVRGLLDQYQRQLQSEMDAVRAEVLMGCEV